MLRPFLPVVAAVSLAACAGVPLPKEQLNGDPGALMFNGYTKPDNVTCFHCHNGDALGTWRAPNLSEKINGTEDVRLKKSVMEGKSYMPAHKDLLSDEELNAILAWLHGKYPALTKRP